MTDSPFTISNDDGSYDSFATTSKVNELRAEVDRLQHQARLNNIGDWITLIMLLVLAIVVVWRW
jgi:hypothetical protein